MPVGRAPLLAGAELLAGYSPSILWQEITRPAWASCFKRATKTQADARGSLAFAGGLWRGDRVALWTDEPVGSDPMGSFF